MPLRFLGPLCLRTLCARLLGTRLLSRAFHARLLHALPFDFALTLRRPLALFLLAHRPLRLRSLLAMNHLA